jgi:hypothetical protein
MDSTSSFYWIEGGIGILFSLIAIGLWFMIPILFFKMYKRISGIFRIMESNQTKIDAIERNIERLAKSKE